MMLFALTGCAPANDADEHEHSHNHEHEHEHEAEDGVSSAVSFTPLPVLTASNHLILLAEEPSDDPSTSDHVHDWVQNRSEESGYNCVLGTTWVMYYRCSICGIESQGAFRPVDSSTATGSHTWGKEYTVQDPTCPSNKITYRECSVCRYVEQDGVAGHK